ncbi:MAG: MFS transporter [Cereibacter changlensis]
MSGNLLWSITAGMRFSVDACGSSAFTGVDPGSLATSRFTVALLARFVGGMSAGLLWALLAGYAVHMSPPHQAGRAMAIAMAGTPLALSIGIPTGTFLGLLAGWRLTFGLLSLAALLLVGWIQAKVPDFDGEAETQRPSLAEVFAVPGVRPVLAVTLCFVLAHNLLYTYIAPLLAGQGMARQIDTVLLVFGTAALVSIGLTGALIDRWLRLMTFVSIGLFLAAALLLAVATGAPFGDLCRRADLGAGLRRGGDAVPDRLGPCSRRGGRCGTGDDRHGLEHCHLRRRCGGRRDP